MIVVDVSNAGSVASITTPALIEPVPVLASAADVRMGAAAAMARGSEIATAILCAPVRVGWIRKLSPSTGAPAFRVRSNPWAAMVATAAAVPPVQLVLSDRRVRV